jgi:hypothetical protein
LRAIGLAGETCSRSHENSAEPCSAPCEAQQQQLRWQLESSMIEGGCSSR